jgi:hypothetical protein
MPKTRVWVNLIYILNSGRFFESLNFPINTVVGKKLEENFSLNINDRKLLSQIDRITLENILNQDTINISPFVDKTKIEWNSSNQSKNIKQR